MFERFDEAARRALFFSRYAVSQLGGERIEPEHLVIGVLRGAPEAVVRFARSGETGDGLRARLEGGTVPHEKVTTSVEIEFSPEAHDVLQQVPVEADELKNVSIRPEHLVLAVLVKTSGTAAQVLHEAGVNAAAIRGYLRSHPEDPSMPPLSAIAGMVARQWRGVVKPGRADDYIHHLQGETLPALRRLTGVVSAMFMRREVEDGTEFQVVTVWQSRAAIEAFAGADISVAVVPPAAQDLLVRYDTHAVHYDIVQ
jgi:heme-degrading monooxygenase HmoA